MSKPCSRCKNNQRSAKHSWCQKCLREDQASRRIKDPVKNKEILKRSRDKIYKRNREYIITIKSKPCMDCGGTFPPCAMEFDHRESSTKIKAVSTLARNTITLERLMAEIAKCDLVCSNCHAIRTWITRKV